MRVPLSWIRRLVPTKLDCRQIAERLTDAGIEVEAIECVGVLNDLVVVGAIQRSKSLGSDSGYYRVEIDIGQDTEPVTVVTSERTIAKSAPGTRVAIAREGAVLFGPPGKRLQRIKAAQIHGATSEACFCSPYELGIGDESDRIYLGDANAEVGKPLRDCVTLDESCQADEVLVLAILPNIARCQSMLGVAREISAVSGTEGSYDVELASIPAKLDSLDLRIDERDLCHRFLTLHLAGVRVTDSPDWLQRRLALCEVESINNIVDASNYVLMELGQPTHMYDAGRLPDSTLGVRLSKAGESIHTLVQSDEETALALPEDVLLIDSGKQPVAVAGVVGGTATAVDETTKAVQLESANFDYLTVRRAQRRINTFTESSARFSRGVDPALVEPAARRIIHLLQMTCPDLKVTASGHYTAGTETKVREISLSVDETNASLGTDYAMGEIVEALRRVGVECRVDQKSQSLEAEVTSARPDLAQPCDLLEEVARLVGYHRMPQTLPEGPVPIHKPNTSLKARDRLRQTLIREGFSEIISYSLSSREAEQALYADAEDGGGDYIELINPISVDKTVMRRSLLPGLLAAVANNMRFGYLCYFFEIGQVFLPRAKQEAMLPSEPMRLGIVLTGPEKEPSWHELKVRHGDYFDAKRAVDAIFQSLRWEGLQYESGEHPTFQAGQCARIVRDGTPLGHHGKIDPRVAAAFDLEEHNLFAAELELESLLAEPDELFRVREPSNFPSIEVDISLLVGADVPAEALRQRCIDAGGRLVRSVGVVDVYQGKGIPSGKKSISLRVEFNARDSSLRMEEAMEARTKITEQLHATFGAEVRE